MDLKITIFVCFAIYVAKALPLDKSQNEILDNLHLGYKDMYDYNAYILGIETVIEAAQKAAIDMIEEAVNIAQEFARIVKTMSVVQNVKEISETQTLYFQRIEDMRHQAFDQEIDISSCAFTVVRMLNTESQKSIDNITDILGGISHTFSNYSQTTYADPANKNLEKTYSVRERIYQCPFSFTDFTPFYVCLTSTAVLQDIVLLSQFTSSLNNTINAISDLVKEYTDAAILYRHENVQMYNVTAAQIYDEGLAPCARELGFY